MPRRRLWSAALGVRSSRAWQNHCPQFHYCLNTWTPFKINGTTIEEESEFCYLGSMISTDSGAATDIHSRIMKARAVYGGLSNGWNGDTLAIRTEMRIGREMDSMSWRIVESEITKAQISVNRCLAQTLTLFWPNRISNEELYAREMAIDWTYRRNKKSTIEYKDDVLSYDHTALNSIKLLMKFCQNLDQIWLKHVERVLYKPNLWCSHKQSDRGRWMWIV